ncbi:EAL domain-containing protein [Erythrobacter sp. R86502]|uniref:EAL domain-containing protein n=1 Tax=Erythrobacter sp. R86502 TaxID=3093846 RepID=UPI0036D29A08
MIGSFNTLAERMRQSLGFAGDEVANLRQEMTQRSGASLLRRKRSKVAALAVVVGVFAAVIDLPLPIEDMYRAVRAEMRSRPAPNDIVMIAIDEKTMNANGRNLPDRLQDSQVVDRLIAAGVDRVVFDRAHADPETPASDAKFAQTLARHKGKVWLGFTPTVDVGFQTLEELRPLPEFSRSARLAAMNGRANLFGLSVIFPTSVELHESTFPSISTVLSGYSGPSRSYRPDAAFDPLTVPSYSYTDILHGRIAAENLRGKNVVIGQAFFGSNDYFFMPFRPNTRVPGAYFHVLGAHTLKRGTPLDLMWYPAMVIAALAVAFQIANRRRSSHAMWYAAAGLLSVGFVLDEININMDVMPALMAMGVAAIGFQRINRKYYSNDVDAMTTTAISSDRTNDQNDVYALKIANLAEFSEDWSAREIGEFVNTLIAYVKGPGEVGDVAFERDILVWFAPRMEDFDLQRHADGLALMLKTAISYELQSSNGSPALGIDTNHELPVALRIKKAMQASEEAATRGMRFIVNDAAHLEARNNRLELIRVLEKGLRERSIGVAYQPKIDLASGRIVGAETLIRWRPDGGDHVSPQDLVLAAEASDRINELTLLVMQKALIDAKQAIALDPRFKLAVNMSAKSLSDTHLLFDIMTLLGRYDFPPENLTLELTETAKLEDHRIAPQIAALKARGISLSIDDFGTGESNLEYIETLPSSELKIDKRFVQHMATSEESRAVVRATIEIAHSLGKTVVAEGVEDLSVAATLRAMGCDQAQGYLFSPAIAMPELLAMMGGGRTAIYG